MFLTFVTYFRSQEQSVLPNINQDKTIAVLTTILRGCLQPLDFIKKGTIFMNLIAVLIALAIIIVAFKFNVFLGIAVAIVAIGVGIYNFCRPIMR